MNKKNTPRMTYALLKTLYAGFIGENRLDFPGKDFTLTIEAAPGISLHDAIDESRRLLHGITDGLELTDKLFYD